MKQITLTGAVALFGLGAFSVASHADTKVTVQSGDTLNKIAVANNTTVDNLQQLNNIKNINLIYVGDEIIITKDNTQVKESTYVPAQDESQQVQATVQTNSQPATGTSELNTPAAQAIVQAESGGDYNAQNGRYIGKYQLDSAYLNGDYSPANQDRTFIQYCNNRYGSVSAALSYREQVGFY